MSPISQVNTRPQNTPGSSPRLDDQTAIFGALDQYRGILNELARLQGLPLDNDDRKLYAQALRCVRTHEEADKVRLEVRRLYGGGFRPSAAQLETLAKTVLGKAPDPDTFPGVQATYKVVSAPPEQHAIAAAQEALRDPFAGDAEGSLLATLSTYEPDEWADWAEVVRKTIEGVDGVDIKAVSAAAVVLRDQGRIEVQGAKGDRQVRLVCSIPASEGRAIIKKLGKVYARGSAEALEGWLLSIEERTGVTITRTQKDVVALRARRQEMAEIAQREAEDDGNYSVPNIPTRPTGEGG
jgi:hypothetical protein